ncbi:hypothetical protein [Nonomuraea candida]|uniref:hypothetical protein n=1 Tax=Nonomuraea candida TaxID=359159 RepID=UPI0005B949D2|nr:hypothetical protein [Nonomuraea candida]
MSRPADNGASAPPGLELPRDFPGLGDDDGRGPYVDHTELRRVVGRLRTALESLRGSAPASMSATWSGPGTVGEVSGLGNLAPEAAGKWEVASGFGYNISHAGEVFGGSYGQLLEYAEKWADAVEKAITNYETFHRDSSV